jgi:hypothetical protein
MFQLSYWHLNRRGLGGFGLIINKYEKGRIKIGVKKDIIMAIEKFN